MKTHILLLILISQSVSALNYTDLPEMNLTIGTPPYENIWDYNVDQSGRFGGPPQGTGTSSGTGYRDAWVKILALDKYIYDSETDTAFASNEGQILTKNGFSPQCPPENYCWPDCYGTSYQLAGSRGEYNLIVNGQSLGGDLIQGYSIPKDATQLDITAVMNIEVQCHKYKLQWVFDDEGKPDYCTERYLGIETFTATINDHAIYGMTELRPQANLTFMQLAQDVTEISKGRLTIKTAAPYSNAIFSLGDDDLEFSGNAYDVDYYMADYNLLRISTYGLPRITDYGLFSSMGQTRDNTTGEITTILEFTLNYEETEALLESRKCRLQIEDLFHRDYVLDNLCETDWKQTILNTTTSGRIFSDNDDIGIKAVLTHTGTPLSDRQIILSYAGNEYAENTDSQGLAEFTVSAEYPQNMIKVRYEGDGDYLGSSRTLFLATTDSQLKSIFMYLLPVMLLFLITAYGFYRMVKPWRDTG